MCGELRQHDTRDALDAQQIEIGLHSQPSLGGLGLWMSVVPTML
ncbi:MAG: hypothetical protein RIR88_375, partial [Actinomycetota bacterium]